MIVVDDTKKSALAAEYARKGYAVLPRLVNPEVAAAWELKYRSLPTRKVSVGSEKQSMWLEQMFPDPSQALDGLALQDELIRFVRGIAGPNSVEPKWSRVWINRYSPGDWVPTHCDGAGSTQLLICLQGLVEPEQGGELTIRGETIPLQAGDAVLFFAHRVPHGVPPIGSPKLGPSGFSRVTCIIRFYPPSCREGASP